MNILFHLYAFVLTMGTMVQEVCYVYIPNEPSAEACEHYLDATYQQIFPQLVELLGSVQTQRDAEAILPQIYEQCASMEDKARHLTPHESDFSLQEWGTHVDTLLDIEHETANRHTDTIKELREELTRLAARNYYNCYELKHLIYSYLHRQDKETDLAMYLPSAKLRYAGMQSDLTLSNLYLRERFKGRHPVWAIFIPFHSMALHSYVAQFDYETRIYDYVDIYLMERLTKKESEFYIPLHLNTLPTYFCGGRPWQVYAKNRCSLSTPKRRTAPRLSSLTIRELRCWDFQAAENHPAFLGELKNTYGDTREAVLRLNPPCTSSYLILQFENDKVIRVLYSQSNPMNEESKTKEHSLSSHSG